MKIVNVGDIEDLVLCKHEIELELISQNKLSEKMSLSDFISKYLSFGNNVYMINEKDIYPFALINSSKDRYLFVTESPNSENSKRFINTLRQINFNLSALNDVPQDELMNNIPSENVFIINGTYKRI